ncbi:MAG TPA: GNAT family N-acetyltransferase [Candidatus Eremiobacteraceae bacterium]|nr:GNAT family N-acetyltransferase [Candidatus Eremiobacteraceae bacterium]
MSEELVVRKCETLADLRRCCELQRVIWKEADLDVEPVTIMVVAAHTGGQVLGAFYGDELVGFTEALVALKDGQVYLHSHVTGVAEGYRDRGIGRALKLFQRTEALSRGVRLIQWTFDPLETRNAHFNLNSLGAISRQFIPNLYGVTSSPLHRWLPTDRLLAQWHLDSERVRKLAEAEPSAESDGGPWNGTTIHLPVELEEWKKSNLRKVVQTQERIRREFSSWFARGYAAVGIHISPEGSAYQLSNGNWLEH